MQLFLQQLQWPAKPFPNRYGRLGSSLAHSTALWAVLAMAAAGVLSGCANNDAASPDVAVDEIYVGSETCRGCHAGEYALWQDSLHAWAMRESVPESVLGRFDNELVVWGIDSSARHQREGNYLFVELTEPDRTPTRYPMGYFLGREQIEQHLVELDDGRLQALPLGFDTQVREWFDIFADDPREATDWGHWANPGVTANSECLYCHTTGYQRGYDLASNGYKTTWHEIGVGCEACHGPGGAHARAARRDRVSAVPYETASGKGMMDMCATCHALRRKIWDGFVPGDHFLDHFDPVLIDERDYGADGSLVGEAYEWGSFIQSLMYRKDVVCSDCHDMHSGEIRIQGNGLCLRCHKPHYAAESHTHHGSESAGGSCVDCHMPERTFMSRDVRRDHMFSIPDPGLSHELGLPDACTDCHTDQSQQWAAEKVESWYGETPAATKRERLAGVFALARRGDAQAVPGLLECLAQCEDRNRRAAAARLLSRFVEHDEAVLPGLVVHARDADPLVRASVAAALAEDAGRHVAARAALQRAAQDKVRLVRVNAAWGLRFMELAGAREAVARPIERALSEWERSQLVEAEDPETHHALGLFHTARGAIASAEAAYRRAIRLAPGGIPARHNLAMLLAGQGRASEAIVEFDALLEREPAFASGLFEVGRLHRKQDDTRLAIAAFTECLRVEPGFPGALFELSHAYVEFEQGNLANHVLRAALEYPYSRKEALAALISVSLELGDRDAARHWAKMAVAEFDEFSEDPTVAELVSSAEPSAPQ